MSQEKVERYNERTMRKLESMLEQQRSESKIAGTSVSLRPRSRSCQVCREYIVGDFSEHVRNDKGHQ